MERHRIARELIRIARILLAKDWTAEIRRKRPDLDDKDVRLALDWVKIMNNPRHEKILMHWLLDRKSIDLKRDGNIITMAFGILDRERNPDGTTLDYQKFNSPYDVLDRKTSSANRIKGRITFNPDTEPTFSNKKDLGKGVVVYDVEDSFDGLLAVRKALDAQIGPESNPWCLASRDIKSLRYTTEYLEDVPEDCIDLAEAYHMWQVYSEYPKRVAFKNGRILAFCASDSDGITWWDLNNNDSSRIPGVVVDDDPEFLERYCPEMLEENKSMQGMTDEEKEMHIALNGVLKDRLALARNKRTGRKAMEALASDESIEVLKTLALNTGLYPELMEKLAHDNRPVVRDKLLENKKLSDKALDILGHDTDDDIAEKAKELLARRGR